MCGDRLKSLANVGAFWIAQFPTHWSSIEAMIALWSLCSHRSLPLYLGWQPGESRPKSNPIDFNTVITIDPLWYWWINQCFEKVLPSSDSSNVRSTHRHHIGLGGEIAQPGSACHYGVVSGNFPSVLGHLPYRSQRYREVTDGLVCLSIVWCLSPIRITSVSTSSLSYDWWKLPVSSYWLITHVLYYL